MTDHRSSSPADDSGTFDAVVLGAGAAGMTFTIVAAQEGLRVLLIEKTAQVGGTTSRAAGTAWIPGNFSMSESEARADIDAARVYLDTLVGERSHAALREQFLRHGAAMLRYMHEHSAVRFQPCPKHTDYYPDVPGARPGGRPVEAVVFDGRVLGKHFGALRPTLPEFTVLGGMMVSKADIDKLLGVSKDRANLGHAAKLGARYAADRLRGYSRGTRLTMGNALCGRLLKSVIDAESRDGRATLRLNCNVDSVDGDAGDAYRLEISMSDRSRRTYRARSVVFAGGGFSGNESWREQYMPQPAPRYTAAFDADDASTMELARGLGAALGAPREHNAWWFPSSIVRRDDGSTGVFPHIVLDRAKPGVIAVDRRGNRFVNEGINYHEFSRAAYANGAVPCWLVCDANFLRRYGLGAIRPGTRSVDGWIRRKYLKRGASLDELAAQIGVDAAGLQATAQRMNAFAGSGEDTEFGKGKDRVSRQNGDPAHTPNPCLGPIRTPPFYAVEISPADLGTSLGLSTNEHARVRDAAGNAIAGLYAIGNDMNSIMGGQYPAPGVTIGPAMTFGYLAALHAAGKAAATD
jgi:hypothetical protein